MSNEEFNKSLNDILAKLEALRPENIIDMEKVHQKAEEERRIIRDLKDKPSSK